MLYTNADQRVIGFLGRALSLELSAVQMYSTQAQVVSSWGLLEAAEKFSVEAREELGHAERIIGRMLALDVSPAASQLRPAPLGGSLREILEADHAFEKELVKLYTDAALYSSRIGDQDSRVFFEALRGEEMTHAEELTAWLAELQEADAAVR
jgi:bacterioferritin